MQIKAFPTPLGSLLITDDFATLPLQQAMAGLTRHSIWKYGWRSNARRDRYCYWHARIAGGDGESRMNCEAELASKTQFSAAYALFKLLQLGPLRGHEPLRIYLNSHAFGVEGHLHQDNKDTENYFSKVYYARPIWHQNWSGETVFYNRDESDILTSIFPRPGRAVTFHGAIPHCARAPSRDGNELRVSLVIKTQKVDPPPEQTPVSLPNAGHLGS